MRKRQTELKDKQGLAKIRRSNSTTRLIPRILTGSGVHQEIVSQQGKAEDDQDHPIDNNIVSTSLGQVMQITSGITFTNTAVGVNAFG